MKRIIGIVFLLLAVLLILSVIGQIKGLIAALAWLVALVTGHINTEEVGYAFGNLVYWVVHITVIAVFIKYGFRMARRPRKN